MLQMERGTVVSISDSPIFPPLLIWHLLNLHLQMLHSCCFWQLFNLLGPRSFKELHMFKRPVPTNSTNSHHTKLNLYKSFQVWVVRPDSKYPTYPAALISVIYYITPSSMEHSPRFYQPYGLFALMTVCRQLCCSCARDTCHAEHGAQDIFPTILTYCPLTLMLLPQCSVFFLIMEQKCLYSPQRLSLPLGIHALTHSKGHLYGTVWTTAYAEDWLVYWNST